VEVWRKGIDTVNFNPKWRNDATRAMLTDGHPEALLITYIGRLGREKRIEELRPVLDALPDVRLAIVGKGPHEEELRRVFAGTNTVFTGMLTGQPLWEAFASADVFCMPSDSETLGFVVLESMASGVPVIGARAGGIPDNVRDGETGWLHEVGDSDAITARVREFQADRALAPAMGRVGRAEAERWSWEKATSILRNRQYPTAIRRCQETLASTSPVQRAANLAVLVVTAIVGSSIVGIFGRIDSMINGREH
jgi:sulfoquinovosyltransferase